MAVAVPNGTWQCRVPGRGTGAATNSPGGFEELGLILHRGLRLKEGPRGPCAGPGVLPPW